MKPILKIAIAFLLFTLMLGFKGVKAGEEYTRTVKKEYAVNPDARVVLNNRFGKVTCVNWDKNIVAVEVTITVTASGQPEADKKFNRITIDMKGTASEVSAVTSMEEMKNSGRGRFSIDYQVSMPVTVTLDVTNKFGDIFINELKGRGTIDLGYGNLDARKLSHADNKIEIRFGKGRVNHLEGASLTLKYSEVKLDYAGSLTLDSRFSDLDADQVNALNVVFEGGNLSAERTNSVDSRTKFTDITIGRIAKSLNLDIQYGSCSVKEMPVDFSTVTIRNKYADVSVGLAEAAKYSLEADLKFCDLEYPDSKAKFTLRSVSPTAKTYRGVIGGAPNPSSRVKIQSEFGSVSLE